MDKYHFTCAGCEGIFQKLHGYCRDEMPWAWDAKWYCGKCYRELKPIMEKQISRRGTMVGERST